MSLQPLTISPPETRPAEPYKPCEELLLSYVPRETKHILEFAGIGVLSPGNVALICGHIGLGKSQVTESVISSYLNPYVDTLALRVTDHDERPVLWIDGERTKDHIRLGFERIKRRIMIEENPELIDGERFRGVHCFPLIEYPNIPARVKELERLIIDLSPSLIVLDGAGDFVRDTNDAAETADFVALLIALANQENAGIITSLHPNPGQGQDSKPRGHLGSELLRRCESCLLLKRAPDNKNIRLLTMDWAHGKNRNQADNLEHAFVWSDTEKMFVSCQYTPATKQAKPEMQEQAFREVLDGRRLKYGELVEELVMIGKANSERTAKRWIKECAERTIIFKDGDSYALTPF